MNISIQSLDELPKLAATILAHFPNQKKFALYGEIGAGKTTLVKQICQLLGVQDVVSSPTYALVAEYQGTEGLVRHLDLYRLKSIDEAIDLNIEEYLEDQEYCFIEWPEIIEPLFPQKMAYIRIGLDENNQRTFVLDNKA